MYRQDNNRLYYNKTLQECGYICMTRDLVTVVHMNVHIVVYVSQYT
jgi:hypothetical protein